MNKSNRAISPETFFIGVLFLFAFFLRLAVVSAGPFHPDTAELALCAEKTLTTGVLHYQHSPGYPVTVLVAAAFVFLSRLFGVTDPVLAVNAMSVFWGAIGVVLFYFLVRLLFDKERAMAAALLLAVNTAHLAVSTFGKSMTLSFCFAMASMILLWHGTRQDVRRRVLAASAAFFGLMLASRLSDGIMFFPAAVVLATGSRPGRGKIRDAVLFFGVSGLVVFLAYLPLLLKDGFGYFLCNLKDMNRGVFMGFYKDAFISSCQWLAEVMPGPAAVLTLAGLWLMAVHRRRRELLFVAVWFFIGHYYYGNVSTSTPYFFPIVWSACLIPMGYFLGTYRKGILRWCALVLMVWTAAGMIQFWPALVLRHEQPLLKEFAVWVGSHGTTNDVVVAIDQTVPMQVYSGLEVFSRPVTEDVAVMDAFLKRIDAALANGRRVFVIGSSARYRGDSNLFSDSVRDRYRILYYGRHLNEDWHHVLWRNEIYGESLFELRPLS